jgi:hypothetical protein
VKLVVLTAALALAGTGCATRQLDPARSLTGQTTKTGCLTTGDSPGTYVLTDAKNGEKTMVVGTASLASHAANHAVRIVGFLNTETGGPGFKALKIDHIAVGCRAPFSY